jgi:hypothetical protein
MSQKLNQQLMKAIKGSPQKKKSLQQQALINLSNQQAKAKAQESKKKK